MQRNLPALNQRTLHRHGDEDARFAYIAVIEKIVGAGFERIGIQQPSTPGDLQPKLMFFITLPSQRNKAGVVAVCVLQYWPGDAGERRRLIEVTIESTQHPVELGDKHRSANPRI